VQPQLRKKKKQKNPKRNKGPVFSLKVLLVNAHDFFAVWGLFYCINASVQQ